MEALVIGGSDGFCFIVMDTSLHSRAGSKAPRKGSLVSSSLLTKQLPLVQGPSPFLILAGSHWFCEGIVSVGGEKVGGEKCCVVHWEPWFP